MSDISLAKSELTGRVYAVISPKRKQDVTAYVDYLINDATQKLQNEHADLKAKLAVAVEALKHYGDRINWMRYRGESRLVYTPLHKTVEYEFGGSVAQDALAKIKEAQ